MANRVADRPHAITIALSLLTAGISGLGIYLNYHNAIPGSPSAPQSAERAAARDEPKQQPDPATEERKHEEG